jgi:translation initiation factor IF-1
VHRTDAFKLEGLILEALPNGTYQVQLANGHRLLGFIPGKRRESKTRFAPGNKVKLQLSPFDLSEGRILVETKRET